MDDLVAEIERVAVASGFSGAVRVDAADDIVVDAAYGLADRAHGIANRADTQFAIASGTKGLTALLIVRLVELGVLALTTSARSILGRDLPLVADDVTVEHLLSHRSGIGDYLDEEQVADVTDYVMPVPVHELATTEQFLRVLDGHPTKFAAGTAFSYCNGGYVLLALLAERSAGCPFHELVVEHVCMPADMGDTEFLRSDELPARAAIGYLDSDQPRTNVFHLPVRGNGDGGVYSTTADIAAMWRAVVGGRIVGLELTREMTRAHSEISDGWAYGMGFWLDPSSGSVVLEGGDAGVSFRSIHRLRDRVTATVVSNSTEGAWPLARLLRDSLRG